MTIHFSTLRNIFSPIVDQTTFTEKTYEGEKLAYGIIVRDDDDYEFFRDTFIDNRLSLSTQRLIGWNNMTELVKVGKLFDPKSTIFQNGVMVMLFCIGAVFVFGIGYEMRRNSCRKQKRPASV